MPPLDQLRVPLRPFIQVLGKVVDLVGVDDHGHAQRVAYFATRIAHVLQWPASRLERVYEAALLHDCGVSSTRAHSAVMGAIDWAAAQHHCRLGHDRLAGFAPLAEYAEIVLHHHTPWPMLVESGVDPDVAAYANLVFLADRVDAISFPCQRHDLLAHVPEVRTTLERVGKALFQPSLMRAFLAASGAEAFWMPIMAPEALYEFHAERAHETQGRTLDWPLFKQGARLLADVVDAKSPFTHEHSLGVSALARKLAELIHVGADDRERIEVAGLLHDIGKLHIPDEILEAPRGLDAAEWRRMRTHSYLTHELLRPLEPIEALATWAASHHERLDGTGYPCRLHARELPLPSRVLAVADIYQALAQDRPYRAALPAADVLHELERLAQASAIDAGIVAVVREHLGECDAAARGAGAAGRN